MKGCIQFGTDTFERSVVNVAVMTKCTETELRVELKFGYGLPIDKVIRPPLINPGKSAFGRELGSKERSVLSKWKSTLHCNQTEAAEQNAPKMHRSADRKPSGAEERNRRPCAATLVPTIMSDSSPQSRQATPGPSETRDVLVTRRKRSSPDDLSDVDHPSLKKLKSHQPESSSTKKDKKKRRKKKKKVSVATTVAPFPKRTVISRAITTPLLRASPPSADAIERIMASLSFFATHSCSYSDTEPTASRSLCRNSGAGAGNPSHRIRHGH